MLGAGISLEWFLRGRAALEICSIYLKQLMVSTVGDVGGFLRGRAALGICSIYLKQLMVSTVGDVEGVPGRKGCTGDMLYISKTTYG